MKKYVIIYIACLVLILTAIFVTHKLYTDHENKVLHEKALQQKAEAKAEEDRLEKEKQAKKAAENYVEPLTSENLLRRVNAERAKVGVAPMTIDENVQKSAQLKVDDLIARNYRDHYLPEAPNATLTPEMGYYVNLSCSSSSENLFYHRSNTNINIDSAMTGWMSSEAHRNAILNPAYTKTGFGITDKVLIEHFCIAL